MKRIVILSLMAIACLSMQAQEKNDVVFLAKNAGYWMATPSAAYDKKIKKTVARWPRTEKDDWFELSDLVLDNVPTIDNLSDLFPELIDPSSAYMRKTLLSSKYPPVAKPCT